MRIRRSSPAPAPIDDPGPSPRTPGFIPKAHVIPTTTLATTSAPRGRWLVYWDPEDEAFWDGVGSRIARRNLICSLIIENICFGVWAMWSALILFLGPQYGLSPAEKFTLVSVPAAVGGAVRIPYTLAMTRLGGRNWTIVSASLMLIPAIATAALLEPGVSYSTLLILATIAGVGGGSFASSMSNINDFFPDRHKGVALGANAAGGNLGVAAVQLLALVVLATAGASHPRLVVGIYIPLVVAAALLAVFFMDNLPAVRTHKRAMRSACRERHTWVISALYIGTFGSFIGFGFAFGQVLLVQFPETFSKVVEINGVATTVPDPIKAAYLTFLGPLIGSLTRPVGGRLADRLGGARVTFCNFSAMAGCALLVLVAATRGSLALFVAGFIGLFITAGIGNGSTYKMIPAIFRGKADAAIAAGGSKAAATALARARTSAVIGIAGSVGAFGGVAVTIAFRESFQRAGNGNSAYAAFAAVYLLCALLTYVVYLRPSPVLAFTLPAPARAPFVAGIPAHAFSASGGRGAVGVLAHCSCAGRQVCSTCT